MLQNILIRLSNESDSNKRVEIIEDYIQSNPDTITHEQLEQLFYEYLEDTTREKLLAIREAANPFKAAALKTELVSWLRLFVTDKKDLDHLVETYSSEAKSAETYTLNQLRELAKQYKDRYLVQGLIRKNILLLIVGAPKTGKTLFITNLATSITRQLPFLNRATAKSRVLVIQNEEHVVSSYKRIYNNGLQLLEAQDPDLFQELLDSENLIIAKHLDLVLDKATILKTIEEYNIDVLIVDSLAASIRKSGLTEYSPETSGLLYDYQEIAHNRDITVLVLHHSTKMDTTESKTGMLNGIAGSSALNRGTDGCFRLFPSKDNSSDIQLFTIPRDGIPEELVLTIKEEEASYWTFEVKREKTLSPENLQLQNAIMRLLLERHQDWQQTATADEQDDVYGLTLTDLVDILAVPRLDVIKRLNHMYDTEGIQRRIDNHKYIYHIPPNGESWLLDYINAEDAERQKQQQQQELDVKMATAVKETSTKEEFLLLVKDWTEEEKKRIFNLLDPATMMEKRLLVNPPKYRVGDSASVEGIVVTVTAVYIANGKHQYDLTDETGQTIKNYLEEQILPL